MLEKQGRDDSLRERFGLAEEVDLGEEEVQLGREMWEAGRERRGLPVEEVMAGQLSIRAVAGTPSFRKGKTRAGDGPSPSLVQALRKTTAKKYDPFAGASDVLLFSGLAGQSTMKLKGKIKDSNSLIAGSKIMNEGVAGGLLAGYGSD